MGRIDEILKEFDNMESNIPVGHEYWKLKRIPEPEAKKESKEPVPVPRPQIPYVDPIEKETIEIPPKRGNKK